MVYYLTVLPCACIGLSPMMIVPWRRSSTSERLHHPREKLGSGEGTVKKKDGKTTRKTEAANTKKAGCPRRPRAHGPPRPRAHGLLQIFWTPRAHGPLDPVHTGPRAHGTSPCARAKSSGCWIPRAHGLQLPRAHGAACVQLLGFARVFPFRPYSPLHPLDLYILLLLLYLGLAKIRSRH
jgi:hypothetical protein